MKTSEERAPPLDEKSFIETLSIDFISPTEIESIKKTQVDTVEMLQKASKKMDEFTQNSRENMVDTEEKLADADESLRNIAEDLRYIHRVCSRVKKGDLGKELVVGKERDCFRVLDISRYSFSGEMCARLSYIQRHFFL